jgi:hypothetical protein
MSGCSARPKALTVSLSTSPRLTSRMLTLSSLSLSPLPPPYPSCHCLTHTCTQMPTLAQVSDCPLLSSSLGDTDRRARRPYTRGDTLTTRAHCALGLTSAAASASCLLPPASCLRSPASGLLPLLFRTHTPRLRYRRYAHQGRGQHVPGPLQQVDDHPVSPTLVALVWLTAGTMTSTLSRSSSRRSPSEYTTHSPTCCGHR